MPLSQEITRSRKEVRERLRWVSLSAVSVMSGVSRQTLWRIREGRSQSNPETLEAIQSALSTRQSGD